LHSFVCQKHDKFTHKLEKTSDILDNVLGGVYNTVAVRTVSCHLRSPEYQYTFYIG
jgi:hypothetical protein